jgi:hypothetical protein
LDPAGDGHPDAEPNYRISGDGHNMKQERELPTIESEADLPNLTNQI